MNLLTSDGASGAGDTASQGAGNDGHASQAQGQDNGQGAGDGAQGGGLFESLPEDIRNALPEEMRNAAALESNPGLSAVLKRHLEMDKTLKDAPKPPETPDLYEVPTVEGLEVNADYLSGFKQVAHENGLSQAQVKALADWQNGFLSKAVAASKESEQQARAEANTLAQQSLQKPEKEGGWGANYDANLDKARRTFNALAGSDQQMIAWARDPRVGSSPEFLKFLFTVSKRMSEDSLSGTHGGGPVGPRRTADGRPMLSFPSMDKK